MESEQNTNNVVDLPIPAELSEPQRIHWMRVLEASERQREYALRMLGHLPLELGLEG